MPHILRGVVSHDHIGGHIAADAASALDHGKAPHLATGVQHRARRQDDIAVHPAAACDLHAVAYHALAAELGIVANVHLGHDEAIVAHAGAAGALAATIDDGALTNDAVVAYVAERRLAVPVEILRLGGDDRAVVDFSILANAGTVEDAQQRDKWCTRHQSRYSC